MMEDDDKPFACTVPSCNQRFTNEDHLTVHKQKHQMTLAIGARTTNVGMFIADQTPTPTRFLRNCEEVGLFQDLHSVNPFEESFKKAAAAVSAGNPVPHHEADQSDVLHTPCIITVDKPPICRRPVSDSPDVIVFASIPETPQPSSATRATEESEVVVEQTATAGEQVTTLTETVCQQEQLAFTTVQLQTSIPTSSIPKASYSAPVVVPHVVISSQQSRRDALDSSQTAGHIGVNASNQVVLAPHAVQLLLKLSDGKTVPVQVPQSGAAILPVVAPANSTSRPGIVTTSVRSAAPPNVSLAKLKLKAVLTQNQIQSNSGQRLVPGVKVISSAPALSLNGTVCMTQPISTCTATSSSPEVMVTSLTTRRRRSSETDDPDEKRRRFLERNRAAATRCRTKRKMWITALETKSDGLLNVNTHLQNEVHMLRQEIVQLKTMLLAHKDCPVTLQQARARLQQTTQGNKSDSDELASGDTVPVQGSISVSVPAGQNNAVLEEKNDAPTVEANLHTLAATMIEQADAVGNSVVTVYSKITTSTMNSTDSSSRDSQ
ncbi:PREDICTED: cyclic AMP-dependent transcription factor ATF-7-like isoform X2 [Priapulus caudatus]|uniref:Cyclic AMP-dependent transcription factor ATF-7-like isoform X2 n=1 Tax=Priapulus caudatus TaxID=37621 RepID=A0ABM1EDT8_PRICU|nr:PREDICTED: cyclic AMP-dependent transcription factor ATF-7-like isoform X2 [Priapulus caudatus]